MHIWSDSRTCSGLAAGLLFMLSVMPLGVAAQEGAADERGTMTPAADEPDLNTAQQAHMKMLSGQRQQKQAEKYEIKAADASSEAKREKLLAKAKNSFEGAIRDYLAALELDNLQPEAYVGLGELFAKAGQYEQSLESFKQALDLDPENVDALIGKARAQISTFKVEEAKASYGELDALHSDSAGIFLREMRAWLELQKTRLGPETPEEVSAAIEDLERWISENESS